MRAIVKRLILIACGRLSSLLDQARSKSLRDSLGYCGKNVTIKAPTIIEGPQSVYLDDEVSINPFVHIWGNGEVRVGRRTIISSHVAITSLTHDPDAPVLSDTLLAKPVIIEHDAWVGAHAIILPGVRIGAHAVVAAGSLVRKDVPPYTIVAGVPAAAIRTTAPSSQPPLGADQLSGPADNTIKQSG
jgi:acetyltransferase-like isoleucine patch superfamily enzyme